jgi:hypothetical protein
VEAIAHARRLGGRLRGLGRGHQGTAFTRAPRLVDPGDRPGQRADVAVSEVPKFRITAIETAIFGFSAPVAIVVAIALAVSWEPLVKSSPSA